MKKVVNLQLSCCKDCPFVFMHTLFLSYCRHPELDHLEDKDKRLTDRDNQSNLHDSFPEWCPIKNSDKTQKDTKFAESFLNFLYQVKPHLSETELEDYAYEVLGISRKAFLQTREINISKRHSFKQENIYGKVSEDTSDSDSHTIL